MFRIVVKFRERKRLRSSGYFGRDDTRFDLARRRIDRDEANF
jgi:hypothetical protein